MEVPIHAPTRGATRWRRWSGARVLFQFTRPRGARPSRTVRCRLVSRFNSRAHEGRDGRRRGGASPWRRFNSRAHEGRDRGGLRRHVGLRVSIHAPTRGATGSPGIPQQSGSVSIHAPTRGATFRTSSAVFCATCVSIHAPTRGATATDSTPSSSPLFQFTRPRGARPGRPTKSSPNTAFQFTRPRGARLKRFSAQQDAVLVSIHAPTRGATGEKVKDFTDWAVSIHAPTRGATWNRPPCGRRRRRFNSRAHEGRDPGGLRVQPRHEGFNSRAHEGRDWVLLIFRRLSPFQFTRPRGARRGRRRTRRAATTFQFTRPRGARPGRRCVCSR